MVDVLLNIILPLVTGIIGFAGQKYLEPYIKRERLISDKEAFRIWHDSAFANRDTFKDNFDLETFARRKDILTEFRTGIRESKTALQTGHCYYQGKELKMAKSIYDIKNKKWQDKVTEVIEDLTSIDRMLLAYKSTPNRIDSIFIDMQRDKIINTLNEIWKSYGIDPMKLPTQVQLPDYSKFDEGTQASR